MDINGYVMDDFTSGGGAIIVDGGGYVEACVGRGTRAERTCTPSRVESMKVRSRIPIESDGLNERIKNINGKTMTKRVLRPRIDEWSNSQASGHIKRRPIQS